mgnify:CR=1 FL=1
MIELDAKSKRCFQRDRNASLWHVTVERDEKSILSTAM